METNNQINSFIRLVMNENLAQAQTVIRDALNEKLSAALDEKFEAYAPAIFEELDPVGKEDEDIDNDGDEDETDGYLKNRRKKIGDAINEEEGDEGDEGDETDEDETEEEPKSEPQVTQQMMPQTMQPSGNLGVVGSDGY